MLQSILGSAPALLRLRRLAGDRNLAGKAEKGSRLLDRTLEIDPLHAMAARNCGALRTGLAAGSAPYSRGIGTKNDFPPGSRIRWHALGDDQEAI